MKTLTPIDLCVALSGPIVGPLYRLFWLSLCKHCNLEKVTFHLINKDVPEHILNDCTTLMNNYPFKVHQLPFIYGSYLANYNNDDVYMTCDYMMKNCGVCKWVCISHFDLWFKKDWLTYARNRATDKTAIVGNHCPIMLVNREAYKQTKVGFSMKSGMDTGQALQHEMREFGWSVKQYPELNRNSQTLEAQKWFHHIGGGGTHYGEPEITAKINLVNEKMLEFE